MVWRTLRQDLGLGVKISVWHSRIPDGGIFVFLDYPGLGPSFKLNFSPDNSLFIEMEYDPEIVDLRQPRSVFCTLLESCDKLLFMG